MPIVFKAQSHKYETIDEDHKIDWMSVTQFIGLFKPKFDPVAQSIKSSKNKKSKWYGMKPEQIQKIWSGEGDRANTSGTFYHNQREQDLTGISTIQRAGVDIPIILPIMNGDIKYAPDQQLTEGIYPEHFTYLKSAALCGQSDRVEVIRDVVDIIDFKTSKKIETESYKNWEGISEKMLGPCSHLDNCNYNHYSLQLSAYLYMILKHNPRYTPGRLMLHHVIFKKESEDQYGYPIYVKDLQGNPVVESVKQYGVPYMKNEIRNMIQWMQDNKK